VRLSDELLPLLDDMVRVNSKATFAVAESYVIHRERLTTRAADFDPFVRSRIEGGRAFRGRRGNDAAEEARDDRIG